MAGSVVNSSTNFYARDPVVFLNDAAPLTPLSTTAGNTSPNWLFAIVSWRQDAGTAGLLQYTSSVSVRDDAGNFWFPVRVNGPNSGVIRTGVWAAPAARSAERIYISPTGYQASLAALVIEVTAVGPWFTIQLGDSSHTNQG